MFHHPFGARQMALIGPSCAISVMIRIDVEDDPCNVAPVSPLRIGSKHPDIGDGVLFVVGSERRLGRGNVGAIRIERRAQHRSLTNERCNSANHPRAIRQPRGNNHGMPKIADATLWSGTKLPLVRQTLCSRDAPRPQTPGEQPLLEVGRPRTSPQVGAVLIVVRPSTLRIANARLSRAHAWSG